VRRPALPATRLQVWNVNENGAAAIYNNCLRANHLTLGSKRLDFLFVKTYSIYNQVTVPWADAWVSAGRPTPGPQRYSDHRGQGALLSYGP
jgi:hypothetical protein